MNGNPLVSVILAVYNREAYVAQSVASVLNQTYRNIQLIIVDDGSTDDTVEKIKEIKDDRIELYSLGKNYHIAYATNVGLEKVKGDYIAIIDSDDYWEPEKLQIQLEYLEDHPEYNGCFTWANIVGKDGENLNEEKKGAYNLYACHTDTREDWLRFFFFNGNRLSNPSSIVTAESARTIGAHNLFYIQAQDMEWWVRFTKKYLFAVIEIPLVNMRVIDGENTSSYENNLKDPKRIRFYNEMMEIRYHFFDDIDDELFIRAFGRNFRCEDSRTKNELKCEKAFLLWNSFNDCKAHSSRAFLMFEELMKDPETAKLLRDKYKFGTPELGKLTGENVYYDPWADYTDKKYHEQEEYIDHLTKDYLSKELMLQAASRRENELKEEFCRLQLRLNEKDNQLNEISAKLNENNIQMYEIKDELEQNKSKLKKRNDDLKKIFDASNLSMKKTVKEIKEKYLRNGKE